MSNSYIGQIILVGYNFANRGFSTCDGQSLAINQNQALFSLLGTTYGGNGVSTFNLPDLRGRSEMNWGQGPGLSNITLGQSGGAENVTLTTANLASHTHNATFAHNDSSPPTLTANNLKGQTDTPAAGYSLGRGIDGDGSPTATPFIYAPAAATNQVALSTVNYAGTVTVGIAGSSAPTPIISPFLTLNAIICLQGLFPSRN